MSSLKSAFIFTHPKLQFIVYVSNELEKVVLKLSKKYLPYHQLSYNTYCTCFFLLNACIMSVLQRNMGNEDSTIIIFHKFLKIIRCRHLPERGDSNKYPQCVIKLQDKKNHPRNVKKLSLSLLSAVIYYYLLPCIYGLILYSCLLLLNFVFVQKSKKQKQNKK